MSTELDSDEFDLLLGLSPHLTEPCSMGLLEEYLESVQAIIEQTKDEGVKRFGRELYQIGTDYYNFLREINAEPSRLRKRF